jgi:hypothetical protein
MIFGSVNGLGSLIFLFVFPTSAHAATFYVQPCVHILVIVLLTSALDGHLLRRL